MSQGAAVGFVDRLMCVKSGENIERSSKVRLILEGVEGVVVALSVLLTWPLSRRWLRNWGSSPAERRRVWPGDRFVMPVHRTYTRAISIAAPSEAVWPWLIQFGLGRGGFYSYELLERLAGIPVCNVDSIVPDFQDLAVGDEIRLHPKAPGIPVAALEAGKHLCFGMLEGLNDAVERPDPARSWSMYVEPGAGRNSSRLLLRGCLETTRKQTLLKRLGILIEEPIDFIMEQRMLRTIRRLVEGQRDHKENTAVASR